MEIEQIKQQVRAFLDENFLMGARTASLCDGHSFMEHHVLDSTGFLELIVFLEETYDIEVTDEDMVPENLDGLDRVALYVRRKQAPQKAVERT